MEEVTMKRLKIAGVVLLLAIVIGGIVFILVRRSKGAGEDTTAAPTENTPTAVVEGETPRLPAPTVQQTPPTDSVEQQIRRFALDFTARFGTYSSDGQSANLKQLMPLLTGELKTWAQGIVANSAAARPSSFTGVTSKALAAKIISQGSGSAVVEVSTQRVFTEGTKTRVGYEIATLQLTQSGSSWLVSSVKWVVKPE